MSGDSSKIGPVGGIVRAAPPRSVTRDAGAPQTRAAASAQPVADHVPVARLVRLSAALATEAPPVDVGRVAALRTAIASGNYGVHPAIIASAMIDYHNGGGE
ncbi:flagellar biosynthesis anti-sigma factor FlgM [Sphingopyxis solisilvae]|uniref:flagellar biosynthesis anti-sigma factor FlgM n=1 Tax=Sphingopyxis solisilvae TaxID=1886788 RepID=UPI001892A0E3|nr:flagellar biosynthesis anti-sigma factor FlgM [Sphingopyxis solisilvae]